MIAGFPLGFAQPLVLLGLLSLPVLWWLLRLVPPRPRQQRLGPEKLLLDIVPKEETPARTPWWLTLLRLTLAALLIIAAAGPLWNPPLATSEKSAPLALLIDDGWAAAAAWDIRARTAEDLISRAETDGRGVAIIPLSETGRDISLETPGAARVRLRQLKPKPHTIERSEALPSLARFVAGAPAVEVLWLSDGVDVAKGAEFIAELSKLLQGKPVTVVEGGVTPAHALVAADNAAGSLTVKVLRGAPAEAVRNFIGQNLPMLILADVGNVAGEARERLAKWVDDGGVLVRFAGPRLAAADDDLIPVKLRRGGRTLGGSLSWDQPQQLAAFARESPFNGMAVPNDVTVTRQVLAEPDSGLTERTWATLADGTPLVTAARRGKGVIVLFHVTADTRWSDLPLSGAFVEMLKRVVSMAGSIATANANAPGSARGAAREVVPPTRILDGFGVF